MLTKRIIPCLDIKDGRTVKGVNFAELRDAGDPIELAALYALQGADELVFLDITATVEKRKTLSELVNKIAHKINIPFTVGGGIKTEEDVSVLLQNGADKIKKRLHFVSLDVTETVAILLDSKKDKDPISHLATFLRYALKQYGQFHAFHCKRPVVRDGRGNILELDRFNSEAYANAQLAGSNGDGELKRFCYLHDPLAAWILLRNLFDSEIWKEDEIRIETGLGQGRGRVILCEPRAKRGTTPVPIASHGLTVKWLDPNSRTFEKRLRRQFIDEIAGLLEIRRSWSRKGNNTASNAK